MTSTFTITDARNVDGNPYEAAKAAYQNVFRMLDGTLEALEVAYILSLNSELQRQHDTGRPMDAAAFPDSVLAKRLTAIKGDVSAAMSAVEILERAAGFDPGMALGVKQ